MLHTALLVGLLLQATPQPAAGPRLEVPFTQFTLPNGLHVILHEDHTVPLLTVNVWYEVGSAREKPGRTGFAHLFEHLMFMGSKNAKYGDFDQLLEAAGGTNNASPAEARTNYYIDIPSNALDLPLFLESDRMAYLIAEMLYPKGHPYRWPTIGYTEDLTAASYEDVVQFFRMYYQPANASLVVAGDIDPAKTRAAVEKWFADVKPGKAVVPPIDYPHPTLNEVGKKTIQDRVQLPRLYLTWITPAHFAPGDAELDVLSSVLAGGKN